MQAANRSSDFSLDETVALVWKTRCESRLAIEFMTFGLESKTSKVILHAMMERIRIIDLVSLHHTVRTTLQLGTQQYGTIRRCVRSVSPILTPTSSFIWTRILRDFSFPPTLQEGTSTWDLYRWDRPDYACSWAHGKWQLFSSSFRLARNERIREWPTQCSYDRRLSHADAST